MLNLACSLLSDFTGSGIYGPNPAFGALLAGSPDLAARHLCNGATSSPSQIQGLADTPPQSDVRSQVRRDQRFVDPVGGG
jgi:hypothetical protein